MGLKDSLLAKKQQQEEKVREQVQHFMSLVNVYIQASSAATLGIIDLRQLPQLKTLKQNFKIPTEGRLGNAEKKYVANIMQKEYKFSDSFFSEIDGAIKKRCKRVEDLQTFGVQFQTLLQEAMTAVSLDMQMSLRLPLFLRKWIKSLMKESMHKIVTGNDLKSTDVIKLAANVRNFKDKLNLSENWLNEICYVYIILARGGKMK